MAKRKIHHNRQTRFLYSFLKDMEYSFSYFNKDEFFDEKPDNMAELSIIDNGDELAWKPMKMQLDYDLGEHIIYGKKTPYHSIVLSNGRSTGKCKTGESIVDIEGGEYKVKDLPFNFRVKTIDLESKNVFYTEAYKEYNGIVDCYKFRLKDGTEEESSYNHPYLTESGWVEMQYLHQQDRIYCLENNKMVLKEIEWFEYIGQQETYAIEVPETNIHIFNGIISHNTSWLMHRLKTKLLTQADNKTGYIVYGDMHFKELEEDIKKFFNKTPFLKMFGVRFNSHGRTFVSAISHIMQCRVLGHDKTGEKSFVALHCHEIIVDECVTGDTKIILYNGETDTIENIVENKKDVIVMSYSDERKRYEPNKILNYFKKPLNKKLFELEFTNGTKIRCTENHKFKTVHNGYKTASELTFKDIFYDYSTTYTYLKSSKIIRDTVDYVYDIEVEINHNYIANGILVHNCQLISAVALKELIPTVLGGGFITYTGVPNNVRTTALWKAVSSKNSLYYKYSSRESVDWSEVKELEAIDHYGKDSDKWNNLVEGIWGSPASTAFRLNNIMDCFLEIPEYNRNYLIAHELSKVESEMTLGIRDIYKYEHFVMGIDPGYSTNSPCGVVVWGVKKETDEKPHYYLIYRCHIVGETTVIGEVLNIIINYYKPIYAGLDRQGYGESILSILKNEKIFPHTYTFNESVIQPYISDSTIILDTIQKANGVEQLRDSRKCHATELINRCLDEKTIHFPNSELRNEFPDQLKSMMEVMQAETAKPLINRIGGYQYDNSLDSHTIDAMRFSFMAIYDGNIKACKSLKQKCLMPHFINKKTILKGA